MHSSRVVDRTPLAHRWLSACMAVMLASLACISPLGVAPAPAAAQGACRAVGDRQICGRFLEEWSKYGSDQANIYVNGLPLTAPRQEISLTDGKTYNTQWFERAKYEAHPENRAPYDLQLGLLGSSLVEGRGVIDPNTRKVRNAADQPFVGIDRPSDSDGRNKVWFPETRHSVSGKILEYWNRYGGLKQFGFPLSEQFQEVSEADNKTYTVQYFERNRFELHPDKAAPYEVELGLLGVQQYRLQPIAGDKLPVAPPPGVRSTKDTLVVGMTNEPNFLYANGPTISNEIFHPLWYTLLSQTPDGGLFPQFVWYVPSIENGGARMVGFGDERHLQIKYKLRPGMKWSDGVEITSNDVIFAYKMYTHPDFEICCQTAGDKIYNIDNPDKYTAIFNFLSYAQARDLYAQDKQHFAALKIFVDKKKPATDALYQFVADVLPEHALGKATPGHMIDNGYWSDPALMVSSGPFKLERWDHGQQIVLVPNPFYTLTAPPILKRLVYRIIPDYDTLIAQLRSGDADVALSPSFPPAPDAQVKQLQQAGLAVSFTPGTLWEHLEFNLKRPVFREKTVRQAIAYAINRQKISDDISSGTWPVMHSFIVPGSWGSEENPAFPSEWKQKYPLRRYPYDPAMANRLLDQAGWARGPDGIRARGGVRLSFEYSTTDNQVRGLVQAKVSQDLRAVGIDAKPLQLRSGDFFEAVENLEFDLAQYAWESGFEPGGLLFTTAELAPATEDSGGTNRMGYSNPHYDELSDRQQIEIERAAQYPLLAEMQAIITEDLPALPLYIRSGTEVRNPRLQNWEIGPGLNSMYKAQAMYFK
jgi:peptide/nickel transport system substrate-binding protein